MNLFDVQGELLPTNALWTKIDRVQASLSVDGAEMAELMRMTERDFVQLRSRRCDPNAQSVMSLCDRLHISYESLFEGELLDYSALAKQFHGDTAFLPERYSAAAQGKLRVAQNYLQQIEALLGWRTRSRILKHFQIREDAFSNPETAINLNLTTDIIQWLKLNHRDGRLLSAIGTGIVRQQCDGPMGAALHGTSNLPELFEKFFGGVLEQYWEKNYIFKLQSLNANEVCVRGIPNSSILGEIAENCVRNKATCVLRAGIFSAIPLFLGYSLGQTRKTSCVAQGDAYCSFVLPFASVLKGIESNELRKKLSLCV